jgi:hypothetical protein
MNAEIRKELDSLIEQSMLLATTVRDESVIRPAILALTHF